MKSPCEPTLFFGLLFGIVSGVQAVERVTEFSANVTFASDYVFRGYSQTDGEPAIQGSFDIVHASGAYAGMWGSNVKFSEGEEVNPADRAHVEVDFYAGYANTLSNGLNYDLGWTYFTFPGAGSHLNYDAHEFTFELGYGPQTDEKGGRVEVTYAYSPDDFGSIGKAYYYSLTVGYRTSSPVDLSTDIGRKTFEEEAGQDYTHYGVTVSYFIDKLDLDMALSYTDTDLDDVEGADDRVFLTVSKTF